MGVGQIDESQPEVVDTRDKDQEKHNGVWAGWISGRQDGSGHEQQPAQVIGQPARAPQHADVGF